MLSSGPREDEGLTWQLIVRTEGTNVTVYTPMGQEVQVSTSRISVNSKYYYGCWVWSAAGEELSVNNNTTTYLRLDAEILEGDFSVYQSSL
jgi:hypothetical protein